MVTLVLQWKIPYAVPDLSKRKPDPLFKKKETFPSSNSLAVLGMHLPGINYGCYGDKKDERKFFSSIITESRK